MSKKLKLFLNFILISIPLLVLCALAYILPMSYMTVEYVMWGEEFENSEKPYIDAKTLIIGDSRAKSSVLPALLHEDTYNIAIGGATGIEMYYGVRNYLKNHRAPETAIIIFAPYHFCEIDNWGQTLYYDYLKLPELLETEGAAVTKRDEALRYSGWAADILSFKLLLPNKYLDAVITSGFGKNRERIREKEEMIKKAYGFT
ncbi:MAG: hypothetical protein J5842_07985, partial [Lachnospiraceae bacterium]|nr:hypothetical protein [Lachnospiraceae bacterium]